MEEIAELRHYIESGKYQDALGLLDEMEEMSRDDKMNRISSLIKQAAEQRTTRSWDVAIRNSLRQIVKINKRRKAGGWYLTNEELQAALREAYDPALDSASLEAFEGKHSAEELGSMINKTEILETAFRKIAAQAESESH
jgi:hypothetical protein